MKKFILLNDADGDSLPAEPGHVLVINRTSTAVLASDDGDWLLPGDRAYVVKSCSSVKKAISRGSLLELNGAQTGEGGNETPKKKAAPKSKPSEEASVAPVVSDKRPAVESPRKAAATGEALDKPTSSEIGVDSPSDAVRPAAPSDHKNG